MSIPMFPEAKELKKLEEVDLFFPIALKKSEFNLENIEFNGINATPLNQDIIKDYSYNIYYTKASKDKNPLEISFKIDKDKFKLTSNIKNKVQFAFKTDLKKKRNSKQ